MFKRLQICVILIATKVDLHQTDGDNHVAASRTETSFDKYRLGVLSEVAVIHWSADGP